MNIEITEIPFIEEIIEASSDPCSIIEALVDVVYNNKIGDLEAFNRLMYLEI